MASNAPRAAPWAMLSTTPNGTGAGSAGCTSPTMPGAVLLVRVIDKGRHGVAVRASLRAPDGFLWQIANSSPTRRESLWRGCVKGLEAMAAVNGWAVQVTGGARTPAGAG